MRVSVIGSRVGVLFLLGFAGAGCGSSTPPVVRVWGGARDLITVRAEMLCSPRMCFLAKADSFRAIHRVRVLPPVLACFPTTLPNRVNAWQEFVAVFSQELSKQWGKGSFVIDGGQGGAVDADAHLEIVMLHNGKRALDPFTIALLQTIMIEPKPDPGLAVCHVMFCQPGTERVIAAYAAVVVSNSYESDRTRTLARSLAREVARRARQLRGMDDKSSVVRETVK